MMITPSKWGHGLWIGCILLQIAMGRFRVGSGKGTGGRGESGMPSETGARTYTADWVLNINKTTQK